MIALTFVNFECQDDNAARGLPVKEWISAEFPVKLRCKPWISLGHLSIPWLQLSEYFHFSYRPGGTRRVRRVVSHVSDSSTRKYSSN